MNNLVVCVLAYNEEKYIARTINSIIDGNSNLDFSIYVYANGCTDKTFEVAQNISKNNPRVFAREIKMASKSNAWNEAFAEQTADTIVFSDGDVILKKDSINNFLNEFNENQDRVIISGRSFPIYSEMSLEKMLVGFMQLPLKHEFLYGGFYAIKRVPLLKKLNNLNLTGLPKGITGEDLFLETILTDSEFYVSKTKVFYEPPSFLDYCKYFARIKWQGEQLEYIFKISKDKSTFVKAIIRKMSTQHEILYPFYSAPAVLLRFLFRIIFKNKIMEIYKSLGPVSNNGDKILSELTRSNSTK